MRCVHRIYVLTHVKSSCSPAASTCRGPQRPARADPSSGRRRGGASPRAAARRTCARDSPCSPGSPSTSPRSSRWTSPTSPSGSRSTARSTAYVVRETVAMLRSWLEDPDLLLVRIELTIEGARQPAVAEILLGAVGPARAASSSTPWRATGKEPQPGARPDAARRDRRRPAARRARGARTGARRSCTTASSC